MLDLVPNAEDKISGVRILTLFAVDKATNAKRVRIAGLVRSSNPRTDRCMRVERFSQDPLRRAELPGSLGDIVAAAVAEYGRPGACLAHMPSFFSDHDNELGLVVDVLPRPRDHYRIEGPVDRRRHL